MEKNDKILWEEAKNDLKINEETYVHGSEDSMFMPISLKQSINLIKFQSKFQWSVFLMEFD